MGIAEAAIALVALTVMEIVLGIDNIVFIAVITGRLPPAQQPLARRLGLGLALIMRVLLLLTLTWIMKMEDALFSWSNVLGHFGWSLESLLGHGTLGEGTHLHEVAHALSNETFPGSSTLSEEAYNKINLVSIRDLIMLAGGLFLIWKSVHEIHAKIEGEQESHAIGRKLSLGRVLFEISLLDVVFSLDSVITAVGMARKIWVMITAIILAVGVMLIFAGHVSAFVTRHPTLKMLALCFLLLIGVMLVADGIGTEISKGYIYFAMAFALLVEMLNLWMKSKQATAA